MQRAFFYYKTKSYSAKMYLVGVWNEEVQKGILALLQCESRK
jgi:hypothetical protein